MERLKGGSFAHRGTGEFLFCRYEVPESSTDALLRARYNGREQARDAGLKLHSDGSRDFFVRRRRVVVIYSGKAIHLNVNQPGSDIFIDLRLSRSAHRQFE